MCVFATGVQMRQWVATIPELYGMRCFVLTLFSDDSCVECLRGGSKLLRFRADLQISLEGYYDDKDDKDDNENHGLAEVTAVVTGAFYGKDLPFGRWAAFDSFMYPNYGAINISSFLVREGTSDLPVDVPEPASLALLLAGACGIVAARRRK
jgi:hypothetical protein